MQSGGNAHVPSPFLDYSTLDFLLPGIGKEVVVGEMKLAISVGVTALAITTAIKKSTDFHINERDHRFWLF